MHLEFNFGDVGVKGHHKISTPATLSSDFKVLIPGVTKSEMAMTWLPPCEISLKM